MTYCAGVCVNLGKKRLITEEISACFSKPDYGGKYQQKRLTYVQRIDWSSRSVRGRERTKEKVPIRNKADIIEKNTGS